MVQAVDREQLCRAIWRDGEEANEWLDATDVPHEFLVVGYDGNN